MADAAIKWATKVEGGRAWGLFEGSLDDDDTAPWLADKIALMVGDAVHEVGADKEAIAEHVNKEMIDLLDDLDAVGAVVVQGLTLRSAEAPVEPPPPPPAIGRLPQIGAKPEIAEAERDPLAMTADGLLSPFATGAVLPFIKGAPSPKPSADDATPDPQASDPQAGATAYMPAFEDIAALPFDEDHPDLTVEQYASFCVERALDPDHASTTAARYRVLTEQALKSLDSQWRQRFEAEGQLYDRWRTAYEQYEAWIRVQKKK